MESSTAHLTLHTGAPMPVVGLGTWKSAPSEAGQAVEYALTKCGYRHIDCAAIYGNEREIGVAFDKVFRAGTLPREEVFITSKLWDTEHSREDVRAACEATLRDLQLEYLDLYLMHWGIAEPKGGHTYDESGHLVVEKIPLRETWEAMEELVDAGLVKAVGVANVHGKTPAQVLLRWGIQRNTVVMPKSTHRDRIQENISVFDFELSEGDMRSIASLERGLRIVDPYQWGQV